MVKSIIDLLRVSELVSENTNFAKGGNELTNSIPKNINKIKRKWQLRK